MNFLEINKVLNKMIDNTRYLIIDLNITLLNKGLVIDKKD